MNASVLARRGMMAAACAALCLSLSPASARKKPVEPAPATTGLIDNVNGISARRDGGLEHFTGLLIGKDGKVERRLARGETRPERLAWRLDGKGRTLIPSFIDSHAKVIDTGISLMTLDLSDTRSLAEAQAKIIAYARDNAGRKWILGRGWDAARWATATGTPAMLPSAADLDVAVADIPVWLLSADGRAGWANSAAMRAAQMAGGKGSGIFKGALKQHIERIAPAPAPKDRDIALDKAQRLFIARGFSAVADMGTSIDDWQAYRRAGDRGALRLRIASYADGIGQMVTIAGPAPSPWLYDDRLKLNGIYLEIIAPDGAPTSASPPGAKLPPAPEPRMDGTRLRNQISRAAMDGFQVALFPEGPVAAREAEAAIAELSESYAGDRRWRLGIEEAMITNPPELMRYGVTPILAGHAMNGADLKKLGQMPNLTLAGGGPSDRESPFAVIARMAETNGGDPGWGLAAFTIRGAYAMFAEGRIGALQPGEWADFLIIDRDIGASAPQDIAMTQVLEHWIGGKRIWAKGED